MQESVIYKWIKTEGREEGRAEGREEGREEGRAETLQQVAINLLSTDMALDQIAKVTGLSIEQLLVLQQQVQSK